MPNLPVITTSAARLFVSSSPSESAGRSPRAVHFTTKISVLPPPPLSPRLLAPALPPRPPLHPLHPTRSGRAVPRISPPRSSSPPSPPPSDSSRSPSPLSELSEDETPLSGSSSDSLNSSKIEKPEGEAGRPGRGGYNLQVKLGWDNAKFKKFQKKMNQLIDNYLNISMTYTFQRKTDLNALEDKAVESDSTLLNYKRCWPVHDHVRLRLKYTSGRERRRREKAAVNRILHSAHRRSDSSD